MSSAHLAFRGLTSALEHTADALLVVDVAGDVVYRNRAARAICVEPLPLRTVLQGIALRNVEICLDGGWFSLMADPVRDEAGAVTGAVAVLREIGAAKAEQERLQRLARSVEQSPAAVMITDLHGAIEYVNPKFTRVTGYSRDEVLGRNPRILKSGHQSPEFYAQLWRTITAGREWHGEFLNRRKTGEDFWEHASISPVLNAAGEVTHFVAVKEDITERKRMEEALRQAHEVLREVIRTSPLAIFTLDLQGCIASWNAAATRMFYWQEAEVCGRPAPMLLPEHEPVVERTLERVRSGQALAGYETRYRRKDGSAVEVSVWNSVLCAADGSPCELLALVADVSERKRLEERLRESHKLEAVGTLAGGMAHDFNNLLMIVGGYAEVLAEGLAPSDPRRQAVHEILRAGERAAKLINQLLAFSGRQIVQPQLLLLNRLLRRLEPELRRVLGPGIGLRLELGRRIGAVRADPEQLEQVILNLSRNAHDVMPQGGCLTVCCRGTQVVAGDLELAAGQYVLLSLSDNGPGMDAETRRHLFEPFFTTKGLGRGTGLGLSTAYGIVRQAGGDLRVHSELQRGTTFEIYLPRAGMERVRRKARSA